MSSFGVFSSLDMIQSTSEHFLGFLKFSWGPVNTFAAEPFSEIQKLTSKNFDKTLTFKVSCGLNNASNIKNLVSIRCRISCRFQKCNKKASKSFCIKSYGALKLPRYFDPSTTSILEVGSERVNENTNFQCDFFDIHESKMGHVCGFFG